MLKYFINRFLSLIPMVLVISFLIFFALDLTPGDPITAMFSPEMIASVSAEEMDALRESLGLNDPFLVRYFQWLLRLVRGDMGFSITTGKPIADVIANLLPATVKLALAALLLSTVLGLLFGIICSIKQNSWVDYVFSVFGVVGISIPEFFIGILAILIFAIRLQWLPAQGRTDIGLNAIQSLKFLVLPACSLGMVLTAALTRYTRNSMLDVLNKDYVKTARAKGLPEWKVYFKHAFRNSLMPVSVLVCFRLPMIISGSVVVEQVFGYAGIGTRLLHAINANDYQLVLIIIFMLSIVSLLASVLIDIFTAMLDPRVRIGGRQTAEAR
ncbi:MAG: ABC transporter permease [Treponema sp.]|jgi:peptide/nickel transport system permease protein|nr:ABC transporter permease [Treponema sp.]